MDSQYNYKRNYPLPNQHDYHVLTKLRKTLVKLSIKYFPPKKGTLLDYGCGSLPYKKLFHPYASRYIGVDIGDNKKADILIGENDKIPLKDKSVDIVLSTQVLEHVKDIDFYLRQSWRLLKTGGVLILSTHGIWPYHPYPCDYHRFTKEGLVTLLNKHSFKCLEVVPILGPFASVSQFTLLLVAERLIKKGLPAKMLLTVLSFIGNGLIWLEDKLFPATDKSDAALFVVCAKKI